LSTILGGLEKLKLEYERALGVMEPKSMELKQLLERIRTTEKEVREIDVLRRKIKEIDEFLKELRISTRDRIISLSLALCGLLVIFFNMWTGAVLMVLGLGNLVRAWCGIYKIKLRKIEEKDQLKDKLHELENKKA